MTAIFHTSFETGYGKIGIVWKEQEGHPLIIRVLLPGDTVEHGGDASIHNMNITEKTCETMDSVIDGIRRMLEGEAVAFDTGGIDLAACNPFQRRVLLAERAVPRGKVSTYGRIARFVGCPGGARAVGNALAANPFPLIIPCHRAVRANGGLGGFRGGLEMKRTLLRLEGIEVDDHDRIKRAEFYY